MSNYAGKDKRKKKTKTGSVRKENLAIIECEQLRRLSRCRTTRWLTGWH